MLIISNVENKKCAFVNLYMWGFQAEDYMSTDGVYLHVDRSKLIDSQKFRDGLIEIAVSMHNSPHYEPPYHVKPWEAYDQRGSQYPAIQENNPMM